MCDGATRFTQHASAWLFRTKLPHHAPSQAASDIIHPASTETRNLRCCERAGQVRSRLHDDDSAAGRTFSRPGRGNVATLKPMTPLHPLMQANVKPPSPLLAPEQQPLKPVTPLQPKNTPKTPISHPQRRWRFQLAHHTGPQRRRRFQQAHPTSPQRRRQFQARLALHEQRRRRFQTTAHLAYRLRLRHQ